MSEKSGEAAAMSAAVRGVLWMITAGALFVLTGVIVREMHAAYSIYEISFLRYFVNLVVLLPVIVPALVRGMRVQRFWLHLFRCLMTYGGTMTWFYALTEIPLAQIASLQFTMPLFTILFASIFLKERIGMVHYTMTLVGFCGALIILRPGMVEVSLASLSALAAAMLYGGTNASVRALAGTNSPLAIVTMVNLLLVPISFVPAAFSWITPGWADLPWLIALAVTGVGAQYTLAAAMAAARPRVVMPFDFVRLPISAFLGYVIYSEATDVWTWVGAVVIFLSANYVLYREQRGTAGRN